MKLNVISHRGNINGPDKARENKIECIIECIEKYSLDVEIDLRTKDNKLFLTHDEIFTDFTYFNNVQFLKKYKNNLWIHCKDIETLIYANENLQEFNYFGHNNDSFVLTSKRFIFTAPGNLTGTNVVCVMPELNSSFVNPYNVCAVLTDYPLNFL